MGPRIRVAPPCGEERRGRGAWAGRQRSRVAPGIGGAGVTQIALSIGGGAQVGEAVGGNGALTCCQWAATAERAAASVGGSVEAEAADVAERFVAEGEAAVAVAAAGPELALATGLVGGDGGDRRGGSGRGWAWLDWRGVRWGRRRMEQSGAGALCARLLEYAWTSIAPGVETEPAAAAVDAHGVRNASRA